MYFSICSLYEFLCSKIIFIHTITVTGSHSCLEKLRVRLAYILFKIRIASCKFKQITMYISKFVCTVLHDYFINSIWLKLMYMYALRRCMSDIIDLNYYWLLQIYATCVFFWQKVVCTVLTNVYLFG